MINVRAVISCFISLKQRSLLFCVYDEKQMENIVTKESRRKNMCTAATYKTKDFYFGRTLDYEFSYGDEITVTPRNYAFHF